MTGKTHKVVGACIGVAFTYWGIKTYGNPVFAVSTLASVTGAMLPDIDHNNSKLGSRRKIVVDTAAKVLPVLFGLFVLCLCATLVISKSYRELVTFLLMIIVPVIVLSIIVRIPFVKSALRFSVKHRGIMHTLSVPLILCLGAIITPDEAIIRFNLIAAAIGYTSHLVLDCLTKRGCPLFWPLIPGNISILPVRTGSVWEYILGYAFAGGIVFMTVFIL